MLYSTRIVLGLGERVEVHTVFQDKPMHTVLPAADLERAIRWYSDNLGLEPAERNPFAGAYYECGGSRFLIYETPNAGTNMATAAGFDVDNFDEVVEHLRSKGVTFEEVDFGDLGATVDGVIQTPDGSMKGAWFKDSEGNIISLSTGG